MIWSVIGITALAGMGGTGMGGLLSCLFRKDSSKTVSLLLSFAAGCMLYVVVVELIPETQCGQRSAAGAVGAAIGFVVMMVLDVALG